RWISVGGMIRSSAPWKHSWCISTIWEYSRITKELSVYSTGPSTSPLSRSVTYRPVAISASLFDQVSDGAEPGAGAQLKTSVMTSKGVRNGPQAADRFSSSHCADQPFRLERSRAGPG